MRAKLVLWYYSITIVTHTSDLLSQGSQPSWTSPKSLCLFIYLNGDIYLDWKAPEGGYSSLCPRSELVLKFWARPFHLWNPRWFWSLWIGGCGTTSKTSWRHRTVPNNKKRTCVHQRPAASQRHRKSCSPLGPPALLSKVWEVENGSLLLGNIGYFILSVGLNADRTKQLPRGT